MSTKEWIEVLKLEIAINADTIGKIAVVREAELMGTQYRYGIYDVREMENVDDVTNFPKIGQVKHSPSQGASTLVELVSKELEREHFTQRGPTLGYERVHDLRKEASIEMDEDRALEIVKLFSPKERHELSENEEALYNAAISKLIPDSEK